MPSTLWVGGIFYVLSVNLEIIRNLRKILNFGKGYDKHSIKFCLCYNRDTL